jgi:hypothetical protein
MGAACCGSAAAFVRGRTAFAHACCSRSDGNFAAALEHCAAGLDAVGRTGGSHDSGCSLAVVWQTADLQLQLQLQQAKCQSVAMVRISHSWSKRLHCAYAAWHKAILTMLPPLGMQDEQTAATASIRAVAAAHLRHPVAAAAAVILTAALTARADTSIRTAFEDAVILAAEGAAAFCVILYMLQTRRSLLYQLSVMFLWFACRTNAGCPWWDLWTQVLQQRRRGRWQRRQNAAGSQAVPSANRLAACSLRVRGVAMCHFCGGARMNVHIDIAKQCVVRAHGSMVHVRISLADSIVLAPGQAAQAMQNHESLQCGLHNVVIHVTGSISRPSAFCLSNAGRRRPSSPSSWPLQARHMLRCCSRTTSWARPSSCSTQQRWTHVRGSCGGCQSVMRRAMSRPRQAVTKACLQLICLINGCLAALPLGPVT